jgi:hypothetical protein
MKLLPLAALLMVLTDTVIAQQLKQPFYWAKPLNGNGDLVLTSQQIATDSKKALG